MSSISTYTQHARYLASYQGDDGSHDDADEELMCCLEYHHLKLLSKKNFGAQLLLNSSVLCFMIMLKNFGSSLIS